MSVCDPDHVKQVHLSTEFLEHDVLTLFNSYTADFLK